jgi:CheY-like chemotaxis protein
VLVVDDDEVIRQLIAVNLTLEGFDVATAVDGQDCLDKVAAIDPDVITLDVMMPRLDGWVTASLLRRNPETSGIKVVLITARAQEDDKARGRQIGVDAYLTKPFDPSEMIRVVRELAGHAPDVQPDGQPYPQPYGQPGGRPYGQSGGRPGAVLDGQPGEETGHGGWTGRQRLGAHRAPGARRPEQCDPVIHLKR